ncbi:hypothetical protein SNE40_019486 [Patella caerulea]|uniref:Transmembrane protein 135 N-terminal domain-containing protein n=1 Tax=Patella caerulea TaxID=87958 RepID=A0AAN8JB90_PATCE
MAVFSKLKTLNYSCYEMGHTWDPHCFSASVHVGKAVFRESLKIYGSLYLIAAIIKKKGKDYYLKKFIPETLRSSIFLTINGFMFVASFCLWRKIMGSYFFYNCFACGIPVCFLSILIESKRRKLFGRFYHVTSSFLPTFTAALAAIVVERKSRRGLLAVYVANLATETAYNMALFRGWFHPIKNGEIWMFSVVCAIYCYLFRSKNGLSNSQASGLKFLVGKDECPDVIYEERAVDNHNVQQSSSQQRQKQHKYLPSNLKFIVKFLHKLKHSKKHSLCRHQTGCMHYILQGFVRMFGIGFAIQACVKVVSSFTKIIHQPKVLFSTLFHTDSFKLGAFLGSFSAVFRGSNCALRWLRNKDDNKHGMVSGFLAGWMMLWYRSSTIALYIASKLVETLYFKGIDKGFLPYVKWADIVIYSISTAVAFHTAALEPHNLRPGYWKFLNRVTDDKFRQMNRRLMDAFGVKSSLMFPDFWPKYDMRFTDLTPDQVPKF